MSSTFMRLFAALAALLLLVGCSGQDDASGEGQNGSSTETPLVAGEPASFNDADVAFATNMVPQHQQAIELAKTALERTTTPDVLAIANQIIQTAQPEVNVLNVFLVQWKESSDVGSDSGSADGGGQVNTEGRVDDATVDRLKSLTGPQFDKLWLESMIRQHQGAIDLTKTEIADGANADAISVAQAIGAEQQSEIAQMQKVLEALP